MAGLNVCKIFLVFGALTRHGFGETLDLTVTPTKTSQLSPEDVYISCRPGTSLQAKSILLIKIRKSGDSSPLASVYHNQNAVVYNPNTTSGIKAAGHIDENALLESFLSIKLEDPTYQQSGSYECELTYLDVKGKMKVDKTSGDVKVIKPDILSVDEVIDDLREEVERLNHNSSSQAKINKEQEKKIEVNAQDFESDRKLLKAVTKELRETKAELQNQVSSTQKLLKALTHEFHETKAKLQKKKEMKCPNDEWTQVDHFVCYKAHKTKATWYNAKETCRKEGGTLVSIYNQFQCDMAHKVARSVGIDNFYWIGLNDIAHEGKFMFDDGNRTSSFKPWKEGRPVSDKRIGKQNDCVFQYRQWYHNTTVSVRLWVDDYCSANHYFVCQTSTRLVEFW